MSKRPTRTLDDIILNDTERSFLTKSERRVIRSARAELRNLRTKASNLEALAKRQQQEIERLILHRDLLLDEIDEAADDGTDDREYINPASPCSICGAAQFKTPSGVTCPNGHGGAPSLEESGREVPQWGSMRDWADES